MNKRMTARIATAASILTKNLPVIGVADGFSRTVVFSLSITLNAPFPGQ